MSTDAGTREAIGAEELVAGAGGVKGSFRHQLTAAVSQFTWYRSHRYLFSLGSHNQLSTVCLTLLHWGTYFYSIVSLLFCSFLDKLSA